MKIWPVLLCLLVSGCSLQQHTDRAERSWLHTNSLSAELHRVSFATEVDSTSDAAVNKADKSLLTAVDVSTYLRGQIESRDIDELSGIAPVLDVRDRYWAINDSGNKPRLFVVNGSGTHFGNIDIPVPNRDWEDLATFRLNGENWIAIGETGDNLRRFAVSSIYFFKQPDFKNLPGRLTLAHRLDFSYEDGSQNVESLSVSARERKIYLISKEKTAAVYTLPLPELIGHGLSGGAVEGSSDTLQVAGKVGQLAELKSTRDDAWWERMFAQSLLLTPTGLDFSADDRMAVVSNYRHVYLFPRTGNEPWAVALAREPKILTSHRLEQSESVSFSVDAREVIVGSEGVHAPLLTIRPSVSAAKL